MHNLHAWENHILRLPRILSTRYQVSCSLTLLQFLQMCKAGAALNSHFNLFLRLALINAERTSTCTTGTVWPKCLPALPPFTGVTSQSSDCSVRWDKLCAAWSWTLRSLDWLVRSKLEPRRNDNGPWEYTKTDYFWALPSWSNRTERSQTSSGTCRMIFDALVSYLRPQQLAAGVYWSQVWLTRCFEFFTPSFWFRFCT